MWRFQKKITDQEWMAQTRPLFRAARVAEDQLVEVLEHDSLEARRDAMQVAGGRFRELCNDLRDIPRPSSREARAASRELKRACDNLERGCWWGRDVLTDGAATLVAVRNLGRLERGEDAPLHARTAVGRASSWWGLISSGASHLHEATSYFGPPVED